MKKNIILFYFLISFTMLHAQFKVRFIVKEKTAIHHDSIYITGTFNKWDSLANNNYLMQPYGENEKSIVLTLKAGPVAYKFTRGNWLKVEKLNNGKEVADRHIFINKDTTLRDSVSAWRDLLITDKQYALTRQKSDTARVSILTSIASNYAFWPECYNADSALFYAQKALLLQQTIIDSYEYKSLANNGFSNQVMYLKEIVAGLFHALGNYPKALEIRFENLKLAEKEKDKFIMISAVRNITTDYISMKDYPKVLNYGKSMDSVLNTLNSDNPRFQREKWTTNNIISTAYYNLRALDSALYFAKKMNALDIYKTREDSAFYLAAGSLLLADIYAEKGDSKSAYSYYRQVIPNATEIYAVQYIARAYSGMARLYQKENKIDSALIYAKQSLAFFQKYKIDVQAWGENSDSYIAEISPLIAGLYKTNNQLDSAYKYLHLSVDIKDNLYNVGKIRQFQTLTFNETVRHEQLNQQIKEAQQQYKTKVKLYGLISIIAVILALAFVQYRNIRQKQKANTILQMQKQEIERTLIELRTTQSQLIQAEKMASLGELTAGIAHEIQNPLNFVNNFAEVSRELLDEMKEELVNGNSIEAIALADSVKLNLEKINHHGKRADSIVKGMLQHSRTSTGQKEPTDINSLADEYLRLSYHGLRAKDKSFNASMKTNFDTEIGKINVVPQEIGRVILNLINNAFYAVTEKKKSNFNGYEPVVSVSTQKIGQKVEIRVRDNGNGIPQKVLDKIFQPFFTTKPSGEGTGLGLSLSYEIITKGHDGELKVETKEGEFTEFIVIL